MFLVRPIHSHIRHTIVCASVYVCVLYKPNSSSWMLWVWKFSLGNVNLFYPTFLRFSLIGGGLLQSDCDNVYKECTLFYFSWRNFERWRKSSNNNSNKTHTNTNTPERKFTFCLWCKGTCSAINFVEFSRSLYVYVYLYVALERSENPWLRLFSASKRILI